MSSWSLRKRFTVAVAVAMVLLATLTAVVVAAFVQLGRTQREVTDTFFAASRSSISLLSMYLDQETGVRGYALTGRPSFLTPYTAGGARADRLALDLHRTLRHRPDLLAELSATEAAARAWRTGYAERVIAEVGRSGPSAAGELSPDDGRSLFDAVRATHARFDVSVLRARTASASDLESGRRWLAAAFLGLAALVVLAGVVLGQGLRRWILLPLDAVGHDARTVAEGDLDREITPTGPPELRRLGEDVERMRRRIVREYASVRAAHLTVEEQRRRLEEQTEELRRSNAELEQFAYVASHDLQEPLRKVASFTDLLRRRYHGRLDERADTYIDYAVDGAHRMQSLINDLLAFSRVGRVGTSWAEVCLDEVAATARRNLAAAIEETGATVDLDPLPTVPGDAGLLVQVFQNVIGNALKFRRPDTAPTVHVRAHPDADDPSVWRVDVEDDGIGIDPQYADRVFVIFTRLNRREDYPGSGIGLALAKKIVEYHGGRIGLGAHGGAPGATITFTLPSTDRRVVAEAAEADAGARTEGE